jgi:exopolyphosphatase / guanosine-5'-triphosphate,3'-diphosphate pyrophosphatase
LRLSAIDIGSNAARLLITDVVTSPDGKTEFLKQNLVRVPLRLGFDVFEKGEIGKARVSMIMQTMKAFGHLMNAYQSEHCFAAATSAMRDAKNSNDIIRKVKLETGIEIKVLTGDEEAKIIYENHIAESLDKDHSYLYVDVGGGSTELTFFSEGKLNFQRSFNIGTIRLLKNMVELKQWDEMKDFLKEKLKNHKQITAIGSGGNINKVFSMSKKKDGKPLSLELLRDYYKEFSALTIEQRIQIHKLREDRADVLVPALQIYVNVMRWADAEEIFVPKIGLADGLIQHLWEEVKFIKYEI